MVALRRATRRNGRKEPSATKLGASLRHVRVKVGRAECHGAPGLAGLLPELAECGAHASAALQALRLAGD